MKFFAQIAFFLAFTLSVFCAEINIQGLDKPTLLKGLWENQKVAAFFRMRSIPAPKFSNEKAVNACKSYIDYFEGRAIKADISGDVANSAGYDKDAGKGMFQFVVDGLRN